MHRHQSLQSVLHRIEAKYAASPNQAQRSPSRNKTMPRIHGSGMPSDKGRHGSPLGTPPSQKKSQPFCLAPFSPNETGTSQSTETSEPAGSLAVDSASSRRLGAHSSQLPSPFRRALEYVSGNEEPEPGCSNTELGEPTHSGHINVQCDRRLQECRKSKDINTNLGIHEQDSFASTENTTDLAIQDTDPLSSPVSSTNLESTVALTALAHRTQAQLREIQSKLDAVSKENSALKIHIRSVVYAVLSSSAPALSEAEFQRIGATPPEKVDWEEYIRYCLYEHMQETHHRANQLRELTGALSRLQRDCDEKQIQSDSEVASLRTRLQAQEQRVRFFEQQLTNTESNLDDYRSKAQEYDTLKYSLRERDGECVGLDVRLRSVTEELKNVKEAFTQDKLALQHAQVELKWLKKESTFNNQRVHELEELLRQAQGDVRDAERRRDQALETLHNEKERLRTHYEETLTRDLQRIQHNAAEDLERARGLSRELLERETRALREARDAALADIERMRHEIMELRNNLEVSRIERRGLEDQLSNRCHDLTAHLKLTTAELTRVESLLQNAEELSERYRGQLDCEERKLQLLKSEFYQLKIEYEQKLANAERQTLLQQHMAVCTRCGEALARNANGQATRRYEEGSGEPLSGAVAAREVLHENQRLRNQLEAMSEKVQLSEQIKKRLSELEKMIVEGQESVEDGKMAWIDEERGKNSEKNGTTCEQKKAVMTKFLKEKTSPLPKEQASPTTTMILYEPQDATQNYSDTNPIKCQQNTDVIKKPSEEKRVKRNSVTALPQMILYEPVY